MAIVLIPAQNKGSVANLLKKGEKDHPTLVFRKEETKAQISS
jgi:hypothetical protein